MPCGTKQPTNRGLGVAAVCAWAVEAGIIASSSGSASVTPLPFKTVRREMCFLVINIAAVFSYLLQLMLSSRPLLVVGARLHVHLERSALHDTQDDCGEGVVTRGRISHDGPYQGHVLILDAPAQRIGHHFLCNNPCKLIGTAHQRIAEAGHPVHLGSVYQDAAGIDGTVAVLRAPCAHCVEVFERQADGFKNLVARRAHRIGAM